MDIREGKQHFLYDERAAESVCLAYVLHILPHPEREDDRLIVYRWRSSHRKHWWYGVTTISKQESLAEYVSMVVHQGKKCRKCGQCGYFMQYSRYDGTPDHCGDCGSIGMNKEFNDGHNHFNEEGVHLLQVDETEDACGFFTEGREKRVNDYIKRHPKFYAQQQ